MERDPTTRDYQEAAADLDATVSLLADYIDRISGGIEWQREQQRLNHDTTKRMLPQPWDLHWDNICNTLRGAEATFWRHRWLYPATSNESVNWMGADFASKEPMEIRTVFIDRRDLLKRYAAHLRGMAGLPSGQQDEKPRFNVFGGNFHMGDNYSDFVAAAVGPHATANHTNIQVWKAAEEGVELETLVPSLAALRPKLRAEDPNDEHEDERLQISAAEKAAKQGDKKKVLQHLKEAGKWVFEVATKIGEDVAAKAITTAMGLPEG